MRLILILAPRAALTADASGGLWRGLAGLERWPGPVGLVHRHDQVRAAAAARTAHLRDLAGVGLHAEPAAWAVQIGRRHRFPSCYEDSLPGPFHCTQRIG